MLHSELIKDMDSCFEIDPITRQIRNTSQAKVSVVQYDHNSERFRFSLSRFIEGHDMSVCNRVEVHYLTKAGTAGVYDIPDLAISEEDENKVVCSWLLSQNATKDTGTLCFLLRFSCVAEDGTVEYAWNSGIYNGITIIDGMNNTAEILELYVDILAQWKAEIDENLSGYQKKLTPEQLANIELIPNTGKMAFDAHQSAYEANQKADKALSDLDSLKGDSGDGGESTEAITEAMVAEHPQAFQTTQDGFLSKYDEYADTVNCHSITTQKIPCIEGDVFVYEGRGVNAAQSWIFYNNNSIVSTGQYSGKTDVIIPSGVNYVKFSSLAQKDTEIFLKVYRKTIPQTDDLMEFAEDIMDMDSMIPLYKVTEEPGYYFMAGGKTNSEDYRCLITEKIPCVEGDVFIYKGRGGNAACSWIFYNGNTRVSADGYNGEIDVVVPSGVNYVQFTSYTNTNYAHINPIPSLEVYKKNSPLFKKLYERVDALNQSNVLYGKKYVAAGDSYTEGDFSGWTDEKGLSGKDSPVIYDATLKVYKTYPWWIAKRNNMTLVNQGICGSVMPLSKQYIEGTNDISYRNPYSNERYKTVPEDADYLTIWFGINDSKNTNLGTIEDATNETFYGAYNVVLEWLLVNRPALKIGLIVTTGASAEYRQAVRNIGKRWGIPILDMMGEDTPTLFGKEEGLCDTAAQIYRDKFLVSVANGHPNIAAHENISTYIESFLRRL